MTPAEAAHALAHDVGKYVARTARNLVPRDGAPRVRLDAELTAMLARDLYALDAGRRASEVLDELAAPIFGWVRPETVGGLPNCLSIWDLQLARVRDHVAGARALLLEADALEPRVRAGDPDAVERACAIALEVERLLRGAARELR